MQQQPLSSPVLDLFLELCAIRSPSGEERAVADRVTRELEAIGLAWEEDDCGPAIGASAGNVLCRLPGRNGGGRAALLLRALRHGPARGRARAAGRRGRRAERGRRDPRRRQQVGARRDGRGGPQDRRRGSAACGCRAPLHAEGGGGPRRRGGVRRRAAGGAARLRLRPGGADRRRRRRLAVGAGAAADVRRASSPRGHVSRGRPLGDRRRRARDRRHAARAGRRGDDRQRRGDPRRDGAQRRPRALLDRGGGALARPRARHRGAPAARRRCGVRGEPGGLHPRDVDRAEVRAGTASATTSSPCSWRSMR